MVGGRAAGAQVYPDKLCETIVAGFAERPNIKPVTAVDAALSGISLSNKADIAVLVRDLSKALQSDVPMLARDGGFIATGWSPEIDMLKTLRDDSRRLIAGLQADYAKLAGITTLKIKHNNVLKSTACSRSVRKSRCSEKSKLSSDEQPKLPWHSRPHRTCVVIIARCSDVCLEDMITLI